MSGRILKCFLGCLILLYMGSPILISKVPGPNQAGFDLAATVKIAEAFDTIIIEEGTYSIDPLIIEKPLTLLGRNYPTLHSKNGDEIIVVTSDSVQIIGLRLSGVTTSYLKERAAIRIVRSKDFVIQDNKIDHCFFGIYLEHSSNGHVANNEIRGKSTTEAASGNAIHAWYCKQLNIIKNELEGHRDGIYFEFVDKSIIRGNHSHHQMRYGLHFMFSNDDEYFDNNFHHNGAGVAVMFSRKIKMINNRFTYNWGNSAYGLLLKEINDAEVINNQFEQNTTGIFVEGSNRIKYMNNTFQRNGWAIKFSGGCSANEITYNNFTNNALDMVVSTSLSDNQIHHNYWSDYTGYDLDKNEIGDIPHYPVKLFSYILDQAPEAIVLLRSFFVDILNFSEKVSPVFTPKEVFDASPLVNPVK